jgi:hypothetical protein
VILCNSLLPPATPCYPLLPHYQSQPQPESAGGEREEPMAWLGGSINFCAYCGEQLHRKDRRWPRDRCQGCLSHLERRRPSYGVTVTVLLLMTWISIFRGWVGRPAIGCRGRLVSAVDATAKKIPQERTDRETEREGEEQGLEREADEENAFCGALTRKGTPCRRRVRQGERCAQHRGALDRPPVAGRSDEDRP